MDHCWHNCKHGAPLEWQTHNSPTKIIECMARSMTISYKFQVSHATHNKHNGNIEKHASVNRKNMTTNHIANPTEKIKTCELKTHS